MNFPCGGWFEGDKNSGIGKQCGIVDCCYCRNLWKYIDIEDSKGSSVEDCIVMECNCNKWISVKDKLPEKSSFILVYGYIGSAPQISTARFEAHDKKFETDHICEKSYIEDVTYWMPLPYPPTMDTKNE